MPQPELTDRDAAILAFERDWRQSAGSKQQAIRDRFAMSPARYYQVLGRLIDTPQALAFDPMLVGRLQRQRDTRRTGLVARLRPLG